MKCNFNDKTSEFQLIHMFEISWCGAETMGVQTRLINKPDQKVMIRFKRRHK